MFSVVSIFKSLWKIRSLYRKKSLVSRVSLDTQVSVNEESIEKKRLDVGSSIYLFGSKTRIVNRDDYYGDIDMPGDKERMVSFIEDCKRIQSKIYSNEDKLLARPSFTQLKDLDVSDDMFEEIIRKISMNGPTRLRTCCKKAIRNYDDVKEHLMFLKEYGVIPSLRMTMLLSSNRYVLIIKK